MKLWPSLEAIELALCLLLALASIVVFLSLWIEPGR